MTADKAWFRVDKQGLGKLMERRGKAFVVYELLQNCWDTDAKTVTVTLEPVEGRPVARLVVEDDDPEGFADLSQAYTLFAESAKKSDPVKRGRFNLGEKLVLALCLQAEIVTTKGGVRFDTRGRHGLSRRREAGSEFRAEIRMTREELAEACESVKRVIPPSGVTTTFNGEPLLERKLVANVNASLLTEVADEEGYLRRVSRATTLALYAAIDEPGWLYEMGIPVVETGDTCHVDVGQRVPLNMDRDGVLPSFLQAVRVAMLNATYHQLTAEDATMPWVREARADERAEDQAVERTIALQFGPRRVIYDPSDLEGTKLAMSQGYTVIPTRALSKEEWQQVRRAGAALPAGKVTPSPRPYSPDGDPLNVVPPEAWTAAMRDCVVYARRVARVLIGADINVMIVKERSWPFAATFGSGVLTLNVSKLGNGWFDRRRNLDEINRELIHELAHKWSRDHLSREYHDALCRLGARLTRAALEDPAMFQS